MVLQVKWWQGGAAEAPGQLTGAAGLAEVASDPVKEQRVGVAGSGGPVEVHDAAAAKQITHLWFPGRTQASSPVPSSDRELEG